ncbi:MarR family transcriptional regulator [Rothia aeria]|uniref:MarR family winged helix-turn-helix transcriptional regulator n=1 Tax=Rothia aeria TaxID=172042 RepID=UPI0028803CA1|nr:MarR family transcriptional regulator [Rothia aeria]
MSRSRPERRQDAYRAEVQARLGFSIKRAEQAMMVAKSKALREYDLSVAQYAAMLSLYYAPGQSAAQLARAAAVTPQTMATVLARLEAKKLITRVPSEIHSRVNVVTLTPAGEELGQKADEKARAVEDLMSSEFTPQEQEQLRDLLGRLVEVLEG